MRTSAGLFVLAGWLSSGLAVADEPAAPMPRSAQSPCPPPVETAPANCVPAWVIDASGVRQLPDRCPDPVAAADTAAPAAPSIPSAARTATTPAPAPAGDSCDDSPTFLDARGIRRVRPVCLAGSPAPAPAATPPA